jgi:hypothetical protein
MNLDNYPVSDGFTYASKLRCNMTFRNLAVQQYEKLRRSSAFKQKVWLVPKGANGSPSGAFDCLATIPANDSYEFQVEMKPGSVIWSYTLVGLCGQQAGNDATYGPGTISFQVRDSCDDVPLFSEIQTRLDLSAGSADPVGTRIPQTLLAKLLVVGPPGLLHVTIANTFGTALPAQVVLWGAEPA